MSDNAIILSSLLYWIYIDRVKLFQNEKIFNSALIHAIVSSTYSVYACMLYPEITYGVNTSELWNRLPLISYGYGIYDLCWGIKNRKLDDITHGVVFVTSFYVAHQTNITPVLYCGLIVETSTIFLNLRPLQYFWNDVLFVITFFIFRLGISPYLLITYVLSQPISFNVSCVIICAIVSMTILNVYWFYLITLKMCKKHIITNS